ncbi:trimethylguanosine synthase-like [Melanaphis sacchari]|uniref:trimethylguanosine synthase-like n=1 Tax=Melanaphis sacchari TaxID=742174 RepID=UPI000DC1334D|nr:trimethylguanosine synthase-like [Melanaphis sacchari]
MNQFDRFNDGNVLDEDSFNSVFPEIISQHIAKQCMGMKAIIDPFCGAGRNVLQLARVCDSVIAIDIDPAKIQLAKNNAKVYNVYHKITFIVDDFFKIAHRLKPVDCIVTSPPWGGYNYENSQSISATNILIEKILELGIKVAPKILLHVPKDLNTNECILIGKRHRVRTFKEEIITVNCDQNSKLLYFNKLKSEGNDHTNYTMVNFDRYCNIKINDDCRSVITKKPINVVAEDKVVNPNKTANSTKSFSSNTVVPLSTM